MLYNMKKYIKSSEVAKNFSVNTKTVRTWTHKFKWETVDFGGPYYINLDDVNKTIAKRKFRS